MSVNTVEKPVKHDLEWHVENCPCKGKSQQESTRLRARRLGQPANQPKLFFNKPGSQNRKK